MEVCKEDKGHQPLSLSRSTPTEQRRDTTDPGVDPLDFRPQTPDSRLGTLPNVRAYRPSTRPGLPRKSTLWTYTTEVLDPGEHYPTDPRVPLPGVPLSFCRSALPRCPPSSRGVAGKSWNQTLYESQEDSEDDKRRGSSKDTHSPHPTWGLPEMMVDDGVPMEGVSQ